MKQLSADCSRHRMPLPEILANHVNLKQAFARLRGMRPCGMKPALAMCGLPLEGRHHRALVDALNIARVGAVILAVLET